MQIRFLDAKAVTATLRQLIESHDEFHWAVAWGSLTDVAKQFLSHPSKIKNVTFGVAFSQTHPDLVDSLIGLGGAMVTTKFTKGTYHPKIYGFRSGSKAAAITGSANFTFGGLEKNWEGAVLVEGLATDPFFVDLFRFTQKSASYGQPVTEDFAATYRASYARASRMPKPPLNPLDGFDKVSSAALSSDLVSMSWGQYVDSVSSTAHHDLGESLILLRLVQKWFASAPSFMDLSQGHRQAIAGLVVDREQRSDPELDREWGWFGSMRGMGDFAKLIISNDKNIARALDSIPQKGDVTRDHFEKFRKYFVRAFANSERTGGYATGSRLLAMKRPDIFVCICNPNIAEASVRMGFARTTLTLEDYWEKIVEVVRLSDWYNTNKPDGPGGQIWENRAAMLDTIFYRP